MCAPIKNERIKMIIEYMDNKYIFYGYFKGGKMDRGNFMLEDENKYINPDYQEIFNKGRFVCWEYV